MSWTFHSACENFSRYRTLWDDINREQGNHILLDSRFVEPLLRNFGSQKTLLAVREHAHQPGVALVEPAKLNFWRTFQPGQSPLGAILLSDGNDPSKLMHELIRALPGYALGFSVTQQDPDFTCFGNLNGSPAVETLKYIQTPRLTISGKYEDYWKRRSKNLAHNLSRQRRRLKDQGSMIELAIDRDAHLVRNAIAEYGYLESTGWKGKEGTAVAVDNAQGRFYQEMLEGFCSCGEAVIYRLLINGKTVASDLCLARNDSLVILKTAYDESVQSLSLGLLLHEEIFRSLFQNGKIKVVEFYGPLKDWHTKWTNEIRMMYHVNFYRHRWVATARWLFKICSNILHPADDERIDTPGAPSGGSGLQR